MKFRPLHDRVVVKRIDAEEKTAGGIIIPDTAKEKPQQGEVIAVGPGGRDEAGKLIPLDVKVGDRVLFGKWSGTEVKIDGVEYLIMKESDIMGVLTETRPLAERPPDGTSFLGMRSSRPCMHDSPVVQACRPLPNPTRNKHNGCQGSPILGRRARQDAARRRHPRPRGARDARPQGPQRRARQELRRPAHHQGRRHRRQGDRARGQVREHGRPDGARGRVQDLRPSPATAPRRRPCSPTRSSGKAPRRWPPA